ncbi:hypothetical protein GRW89_15475 [Pseudomonas moraviensis]|uniref:hypothetical protein n=1 Tax=Pseudomonas TaxID=286 RepID=UPI00135DC875|nr:MULTISPECIES: hypothetical protein [Pseudomonas]MXI47905.1 hypothetical protein [Pseudomonas moraviensis]UST62191.1 hypothetical protein NF673_16245 [Pseudomonas moraviensis]WGT32475.1 hypothetical protein QG303_19205 [Pseudomonas atacamensis]CAH0193898.1 hypothetical protein SRABI89_01564 [Pseudomonas koreensis]
MSLTYQDPSIDHDESVRLLASGAQENVICALISIGLNEPDGSWAEEICAKYLSSETEAIAASAITALGHIARRHGRLNTETVLPALENVRRRMPSLQGVIEDTIDDIEMFT